MLSFDYTVDLQLQDTLRTIDRMRSHILTTPLPPTSELKLQWEGSTIRTWATLALAGFNIPKHHVATLLSHPTRPTTATRHIYEIREAYDYIHASWRANPKAIHAGALRSMFTKPDIQPNLDDLLEYLSQERAHPVIQASIAHLHVLTLPNDRDLGTFARLIHYLVLAKYGYDVRGFVTPDRAWLKDAQTYFRLKDKYLADRHMSPWLAFMAESMRNSLDLLKRDIGSSHFYIEFPQSFWSLSDRQKKIVQSLASAGSTITNKKVQKLYKISQITASRDLSHLSSLGILFAHGKGRSVYYSKI